MRLPVIGKHRQIFFFRIALALTVGVSYALLFYFNKVIFSSLAVSPVVSWLYLPAGLRLLGVLLAGKSGALGIVAASFGIYLTSNSSGLVGEAVFEAFVVGLISGGAPFISFVVARQWGALAPSLLGLRFRDLIVLTLIFAALSAVSHQIFYSVIGVVTNPFDQLIPMFVGDLLGSLVVLLVFFFLSRAIIKSLPVFSNGLKSVDSN